MLFFSFKLLSFVSMVETIRRFQDADIVCSKAAPRTVAAQTKTSKLSANGTLPHCV